MAEITNKVVTVPLLQHYKEKEDTANGSKFVSQEPGKGLIESEKVTKLDEIEAKAQVNKIEGIQINGSDIQPDETSKKVNITAEVLAPDLAEYVKTEDADKNYVKSSDFDSKVDAKIGELGVIQGSCEKADLESKKEGATENDVWIVTDDDNHMYFYNGTDFVDTQAKAHVDLSGYVQTEEGKSLVLDTDITQITTNKTDIATINEKLGKLQEAEEADIDALFTE